MFQKHPDSCRGCPLDDRGQGFVPPIGPANSPILLYGEAPGYEEALYSEPFVGASGALLNRILQRNHWDRSSFRIHNVLSCRPPNNWLEGAPYQHAAINHCAVHRAPVLAEPHTVVVAIGGTALKTLTGLGGKHGIRIQDAHGTVFEDPEGRFLIVPTYHTSHLQRGAAHLFGTVSFDLQVAQRVVAQGRPVDAAQVVCDPTVEWFQVWADQVCEVATRDPQNLWLAVDLETPDKASGRDEGELSADDRSYTIVRVNVSVHPDEGVTVPYQGPYIAILDRLLKLPCPKLFWNAEYDVPRLTAAGHTIAGDSWDFMWCLGEQTRIPLWEGQHRFRSIKDIVENRESVTLVGMDERGNKIPVRVIDWHRREVVGQQFLQIRTDGTRYSIYATPEHKIWTQQGWKRADAIEAGDRIPLPTSGSDDFIHGTLLGDGYVDNGNNLQIRHSLKQADWAHAKANHLSVSTYSVGHDTEIQFSSRVSRRWRRRFYAGKRKRWIAPPSMAALAVWYADDGSYHRNRGRRGLGSALFCCHSFGQDIKTIVAWFIERFGPEVRVQWARPNQPIVTLHGDTCRNFFALIAPWLHPSMAYKVNEAYRDVYNGWLEQKHPQWATVELVRPAPRMASVRYCVTVDHPTHRFFTAGGLVSNCWHHLQSDLPRGLGFVAPFYSNFGAWKHLSDSDPVYYAAIDGFQTYRVATGIARDLTDLGMWDCFARHTHALHKLALKPAQEIGVKIDRQKLEVFIEDLGVKQRRLLHAMQGMVPEEVRPLTPKGGLKTAPKEGVVHSKGTELKRGGSKKKKAPDPIKQDLYAQVSRVVTQDVPSTRLVCTACGADDVQRRHRCPVRDRAGDVLAPALTLVEGPVTRYFWQEPFNPDSPQQILAYLTLKGHKPGKAKKTGNDSTDKETLDRLAKETKDPLYRAILDSRAIGKVRGTYGVGTLKRLDKDDRVHPVPTFAPSTHRLSYRDPNITNVVADKDGAETLAAGFRSCVVPMPECRLLEVDFAAIEAKLTGWYCRDPEYIRLASLGVHGALCTYLTGKPYDPRASDADLTALFKSFKKSDFALYDRAKHAVYGDLYGQTEYGMIKSFPASFPTLKVAKKFKDVLHQMAPMVPKWQGQVRERAYAQNYLGGPGDHPFSYRHWFWAVLSFRPITHALYQQRIRRHQPVTVIQGKYFAIVWGTDSKRCVAFYPQSTAAGILKEAMLRLFDPVLPNYIGDAYYGRTPLRAPIHDSLFLEVPNRVWDRVTRAVVEEMTRPIPQLPLTWVPLADRQRLGLGDYLSIGIEAKGGQDWGKMEPFEVPLGVSGDSVKFPIDEDAGNEEDFDALGVSVA